MAGVSLQRVGLGQSGVRIPPMGVGTWAWGDRLMWGYGRGYGEADLRGAFEAALRMGVPFFDTAEIYGRGRSERLLGAFMAEAAGDGRNAVVVATKFLPFPWRLRRASLLRALTASLTRLGLRRVDLYQIHWPFPPVPIETWMDALAEAVESGLARAVGVSNYTAAQMRRAYEALARRGVALASNQVEYSLLHRRPERNGVLQACRELGVTLIAYSPLAMGLLSGKYTPAHPPPGLRGRRFGPAYLKRLQRLTGLLREIGEAHGGKTAAQVALNWVIGRGAVPIPGAKSARQVEDNAGALGWQLTAEEMEALEVASEPLQL